MDKGTMWKVIAVCIGVGLFGGALTSALPGALGPWLAVAFGVYVWGRSTRKKQVKGDVARYLNRGFRDIGAIIRDLLKSR